MGLVYHILNWEQSFTGAGPVREGATLREEVRTEGGLVKE